MEFIDDWTSVYPRDSAHGGGSRDAPVLSAQTIRTTLESVSPSSVYCYRDEGLAWIKVGFAPAVRDLPSMLLRVGRLIGEAIGAPQHVYFHALRPHDMTFVLEAKGMRDPTDAELPASAYGAPIAPLERKGKGERAWFAQRGRASMRARRSPVSEATPAAPRRAPKR